MPLEYMLARRLLKSELDVLSRASVNGPETTLKFGKNRPAVERLIEGSGVEWQPFGSKSEKVVLTVHNPASSTQAVQDVSFQQQTGKRNEIKLRRQRQDPVLAWSEPVLRSRPNEGDSWALLIRADGRVYARFVRSIDNLVLPVADRLRQARENSVSEDFRASEAAEDENLGLVVAALRESRNVLLYGPPGTGKTYLMQQIRRAFTHGFNTIEFDPGAEDESDYFRTADASISNQAHRDHVKFLTFHPSTSYEGFVVGMRPEIRDGDKLAYRVVPGPLLELARDVYTPGHAGLLLIDEINRGNAAEIFGELVTLLESDKRLRSRADLDGNAVGVRLPYKPEPVEDGEYPIIGDEFYLPDEIYTVASMNSLDRSVAPLDAALRRRFRVVHLQPNLGALRAAAETTAAQIDEAPAREAFLGIAHLAHDVLAAVNEHIALYRGPEYRLGQSYVWRLVADASSRIEQLGVVVANAIVPQLQELFRNQPDVLAMILGGKPNDGLIFKTHSPATDSPVDGATEWVEILPFHTALTTGALRAALTAIAATSTAGRWGEDPTDELTEDEDDEAVAAATADDGNP